MTNPTASLRSDYCPICPGIGVRQLSESVSDFIGIRIIVMSAEDNIVKGASGQAVQSMNILCGFPETAGLV